MAKKFSMPAKVVNTATTGGIIKNLARFYDEINLKKGMAR
jgi:hypothetical protein